MTRAPKILVFDSGLGGLTVFTEVAKIRPHADFVYCADDAGFPYGSWSEGELVERVLAVMESLISTESPDIVAIACNTASTLVLSQLRARWTKLPFVGTVPAIKPAAQISETKLISVLATPGTVARDYTQRLIQEFAGDCGVTLVGSGNLARFAERAMHGEKVSDAEILAEISPCFQQELGARTDAVVLACTHYPLLAEEFARLAPWPVHWINPAPAIARRVDQVLFGSFGPDAPIKSEPAVGVRGRRALFTSGEAPTATLAKVLARYGLSPSESSALAETT
ncbi:MAG: glutamate racemase [Methylocystis sp.]|jgi:glutamate racemase